MISRIVLLAVAAVALASCSASPGKSQVQKGLNELAKESPLLFGSEKPIVRDAKCKKTGNDIYDCTATIAVASMAKPMTATLQLTKLSGAWHASIIRPGA